MTLARTLQTLRRQRSWTQAELAERAEISTRTVGEIESGVQLHPRAATLVALFDALEIDDAERRRLFASLRVADREITDRTARLPHNPFDLIGRAADLAAIETRVAQSAGRIVTLVGPAGVGKSALAIAVARRLADRFPGKAVFVDAQPLETIARLRERLLAELGLATDDVAVWRAQPPVLVAIDNLEHLASAAVEFGSLVERLSFAHVLVTSREVLRLRGERVVRVEPLAPDDAVALFFEHARRLHLAAAQDVDAALAAAICERVDRLPLGIELAVPRLRALDARSLLEGLETDPDVLTSVMRDAPSRHRSMTAAIASSFRSLASAERDTLEALALFRGSASLAGLAYVLERAHDGVRATVAALESKSLVRVATLDDDVRISLLETIREYVLRRSDADARRAHREERFATFVRDAYEANLALLVSVDRLRGERRMQADRENVDAAMRWAVARRRADVGVPLEFAFNVGRAAASTREPCANLEALLPAIDRADPRARELVARGHAALGFNRFLGGDLAGARASAEVGLAALGATSPPWASAIEDFHFVVLFESGDYDRAFALGEANVAKRRASASPMALARTLSNVGMFLMFADRIAEASPVLDEAAALHADANSAFQAGSLRNLALHAICSGDLERARTYARLADELTPADDKGYRLPLEIVHGEIALAGGDLRQARDRFALALDLALDLGTHVARHDAIRVCARLAETALGAERIPTAAQAFGLSRDFAELWSLPLHPYEARRTRPLVEGFPERSGPRGLPTQVLRAKVTSDLATLRANVERA